MQTNSTNNYWDTVVESGPYQMGPQTHRVFLLHKLFQKGVLSILDVGCGTGPIYPLAKDMFVYKGVDYSNGMIRVAKENLDGSFEVQDATNLEEEDRSWDAVILVHSLDHVKKWKKAISEAARVARKYVIVVLWKPFLQTTTVFDKSDYGPDTYLVQFSKDELDKEFEKNGLKIEEVVAGQELNSQAVTYNYLYLLCK